MNSGSSDTRDYVLMDPTNAYPKKELKGWRRHVTLEKPVITVVVDEVKSDRARRSRHGFIPIAVPTFVRIMCC